MIEPRYLQHPKYRGLVIRRNADDLRDWIDRARHLYLPTRAIFSGNPVEIKFPSGAKIRTGHLKDENAYGKYQGHEYQKMLIEELSQIPREKDFEKLKASNRSTITELKPQIFATTNPDGDGADWVKKRFSIPDKPTELVRTEKEFFDKITEKKVKVTRVFLPSKLEDNTYLFQNNNYLANLVSITDDTLRRQWREGDWTEPLVEGAYYRKEYDLALKENRICNVPIETVPTDTFWDLGIGDSMAIWCVQFVNKEIRLIDYLEGEGEGMIYYIRELQKKNYVWGEHFMPHDAEVREMTSGISRKQAVEKCGFKPIRIAPRLPIDDGIDAVRRIFNKFWIDKERCEEGIRAIKNYKKEYDEKRQEFKNVPYHNWASHGADALRTLAVCYYRYKNTHAGEIKSWRSGMIAETNAVPAADNRAPVITDLLKPKGNKLI